MTDTKLSAGTPRSPIISGVKMVSLIDNGDGTFTNETVDQAVLAEFIRDTMGACLTAGSNVTITVNDAGDTITLAASGGGGGSGLWTHPGIVSGKKYPMDLYTRLNAATGVGALVMAPFRVPKTGTIAGLAARIVTGGTSAHIQAGIYANSAGAPVATGPAGQVVLDASATASTPYTAFGSAVSVTAGDVMWMVCNADVASTVTAIASTDPLLPWLTGYDESVVAANGSMSAIATSGGAYSYATGLPTGAFPAMVGRTAIMPIIDLVYS